MSAEERADKRGLATSVLQASELAAWDDLVATSPHGGPYAYSTYLTALARATGASVRILGVRRGGELLGGVPLYEQPSRFGSFVSNRLLLRHNGLVLRETSTKYPSQRTARLVELQTALCEALDALEYGRLRLHSNHALQDVRVFVERGWTVSPAWTYLVPLVDLASQWGRVEQNLRRLVERARRAGLVLVEDEDFDAFWTLHAATLERKGAPEYLPRERFTAWFRELRASGLVRLFHARTADGRSVAAQLVLASRHPVSHTVAAAADARAQKDGANAFLRWCVFERLAADGYAANDLTDAGLNPVTHFKSQLGGELVCEHVLERPASRRFRWGNAAVDALRRVKGGG